MNKQKNEEMQDGESQIPDPLNGTPKTADNIHLSQSTYSGQNKDIEKEFVFNFRTFKEVFPYISSVSISDHSEIEQAYYECVKQHIKLNKKKQTNLSNVVVIQFHKTTVEETQEEEIMIKQKQWSNFFTYVHVPFNDENINPDISTMSEIIGRAMEKKSETKVFD